MNFRAFLICGVSMLCGLGLAITIMGQSPAQQPKETARAEVDNAMRDAEMAEASYVFAIEENRKQPGTVSDEEIERLHGICSDTQIFVLKKQGKLLQADVDQLRTQVQELGTVKIKPVGLK